MRVQVGITSTVRLRAGQEVALRRHAGASRFAYNWGVHRFRVQRKERDKDPTTRMLYSPFAFIQAFGDWKKSAAAGCSEVSGIGLAWRAEVSAQVMEEGAADCGKAVASFLTNLRDRKRKKPNITSARRSSKAAFTTSRASVCATKMGVGST